MGVPLLFGYFCKNYRYIFSKRKECDNFFLDYNALIHNIVNENPDIDQAELFYRVKTETLRVVTFVNPKKLVYIAIDGVVPRSKINQQRMRRFKSRSSGKFDRNQITPGTQFMYNLSDYLRNELKFNVPAILSLVEEEGEGEQKIIDYCRKKVPVTDSNVIYGLDADLIILTMSLNLKFNLLRDNSFLDIDKLKNLLIEDLSPGDPKKLINDFVLISIFLGNDFLIGIPTLKIKRDGVGILLKIYKKFRKNNCYLLDQNNQIIPRQLQIFLNLLGSSENYSLSKKYEDVQKI